MVVASNRSVLYSIETRRPSVTSDAISVRSNFAARHARSKGSHIDVAQLLAASRRVLQNEHDLEQRIAAQVAIGPELLHQLLEGQVLVGVGAQAVSRTRVQQLAEAGSSDRSARSTSVLTKKPISLSISARLRPAIGVPTHHILLAGVAREQDIEGRQQRHEQRRALAAARAAASDPVSPSASVDASVAPR